MIDLHSHILPGIDDGSTSIAMSLEMARIAVADGTRILACTPHIMPGVYENNPAIIASSVKQLSLALAEAGIDLALVAGADIHVVPDMADKLSDGRLPVLRGTRYFLFEPPHHVFPPGLDKLVASTIAKGFVPVLTHPERLTWIEQNYELIVSMAHTGAVVQLTAASITGGFGKRAQYWSQRMLEEGLVHLIASDAHNTKHRPPGLSKARDQVAQWHGEAFARQMVFDNPAKILRNETLPVPVRTTSVSRSASAGSRAFLGRIFGSK